MISVMLYRAATVIADSANQYLWWYCDDDSDDSYCNLQELAWNKNNCFWM